MAAIAICVWGSTFIFSKIMLRDFTPLQIMTMRFVVAYIVLWCLYPKVEKTTFKDNLGIFVLSLFGNTIYFLFENNALQYTLAANVSIIVASAPIWTAILAHFFSKGEKIRRNTIYGSALAFAGVALVVFNGTIVLKFNPLGDILSLGAALSWAVYSILVVKYVNRFSSLVAIYISSNHGHCELASCLEISDVQACSRTRISRTNCFLICTVHNLEVDTTRLVRCATLNNRSGE